MVIALIPARYGSTRFPGKPLASIAGKPMVQHVYERVNQAAKVSHLYVVTDDERIAKVVQDFGGEYIMTDPDLPTGTDRIASAALETRADIIVNVQGDEPLIEPGLIDDTIDPVLYNPNIDIATPIKRITSLEDLTNPNVVKVVLGEENRALYFSRSAIPYRRDIPQEHWLDGYTYWKHLGLYVYRKPTLLKFAETEQTDLERAEQLEQLRILAQGAHIRCVETEFETVAVDRPEDITKVEALITA